jgi:hypothetical protein
MASAKMKNSMPAQGASIHFFAGVWLEKDFFLGFVFGCDRLAAHDL